MSAVRDATVTTPETREATLPLRSIITVVGIALAGRDLLNPIRIESSISVGYGVPRFRVKASALTGLSRVRIQMN
jgi:hypothetical protein